MMLHLPELVSCFFFSPLFFCQATIVLTPSFWEFGVGYLFKNASNDRDVTGPTKTSFVFLRTLGFPSWFHMEMAGLPDCHPRKPWGEGPAHRDQATGEWQGHFGTRADAGDLEWWSHKWRESVEVFGGLQYYIIIYIENSLRKFGWIYGLGGLDKTFAYICNPKRSWFSLANFWCGELRTLIFVWCCFVWNEWFSHMFFEMSDFPLCSQHHLHPAGHLEVRGPKKGGNVYLDDSWCPQPTSVNVTSTCVDVTFTQTLTQLLSGILKLIRWCFVSKLDVLFKINVTFQRLKKTMLLQAIVELPSLKPTVRTWKWMDGKPEARPLFRGSGARVLLAPKSDLTALWLDLKSSRLHLRRWVIPANDSRKILS